MEDVENKKNCYLPMNSIPGPPPPRILLLYPPITRFERYSSSIGSAGGQQIPLGIYYLAAYLLKHGVAVSVIDAEANNYSLEQIYNQFESEQCNLLGISTTTVAFKRTIEVADYFKKRNSATPIIVGGPHVSSQTKAVMQCASIDYAIPYEGEITLYSLIQAICRHDDLSMIEGIIYRDNGSVVETRGRPLIEDINSIPFPAFQLIPDIRQYTPPPCNYRRSPVVNVITSRGCPNNCTFCENATFGRRLRLRSAENVVEEIELHFSSFGAREIAFVDDTFTMKPQRIYDIFNLLTKKGLNFPWTCMARIDTVDEKLLAFMKEHGCWHISFGIESADQHILDTIRKNIQLEQVRTVIGTCHKLGILTKGFFMVGHPNETLESINKTISFATKLALDDVVVTINTPMPGTEQFENIVNYGTIDTSSWTTYNYWNPVFVPYGLTRDILTAKHKEFYRRFYLRPRIVLRYIKALAGPAGMKRLIQLLKAFRFLLPGNSRGV
jgi:anaerobic magnesium-protoporphyrin IX monomethyl ester cyclase